MINSLILCYRPEQYTGETEEEREKRGREGEKQKQGESVQSRRIREPSKGLEGETDKQAETENKSLFTVSLLSVFFHFSYLSHFLTYPPVCLTQGLAVMEGSW